MLRALYTAASGMAAQQYNMETVSHNLANVNTTGFKKGRAEFQDLLYSQLQSPLRGEQAGVVIGHGARLSGIQRIFSGGTLQASGGDYDVAIQGGGFFRVRRPDGSFAYTRDGAFGLDAQRRLVTSRGDVVMGAKGPITVPAGADKVQIGTDGTVRWADPAKAAAEAETALDRIQLAVFANPAGLEAMGDNLWRETGASGRAALIGPGEREAGVLVQNHLEGSNVQSVEEMVNLIVAQRAYEINSKVVQSADDMLQLANNLRR